MCDTHVSGISIADWTQVLRVILCDHMVMSQGHEILPGIVAHLSCGGGDRESEDRVYNTGHEDTAGPPQCRD